MTFKPFIILIAGISLSLNTWGQQGEKGFEGDRKSMDYLLYLFKEDKGAGIEHGFQKQMYRNRIPDNLGEKFLSHELKGTEEGFFTDSIAFSTDQFYALVYTIPRSDEERSRESYLTTITKSGKHLSTILFSHYKRSNLALDTADATIIQQRLIERAETAIRYSSDNIPGKRVDTHITDYHHYELKKSGKIRELEDLSPTGYREYFFTSERLVKASELEDAVVNELQLMRNEIYADYGYKFPVDRWEKHFNEKGWYKPQHDKVFDKMNLVEQMNVKRIIRYERKKR